MGGYLLKRCFVDGIRHEDEYEVSWVLGSLQGMQKRILLDGPIDELLNTPLHLAVQLRSTTVTKLLLAHGADPQLQNLMGDSAAQRFIFPRLSQAAALVRSAGQSIAPRAALDVVTAAETAGAVAADDGTRDGIEPTLDEH